MTAYGIDLVNSLCMRLHDVADETSIIFEVLVALDLLLELDREFPSDFSGDGTVNFLVDTCGGFDEVEQL